MDKFLRDYGSGSLDICLDLLRVSGIELSSAETVVATSMLSAGFDVVEVAQFFYRSPWGHFYRECTSRFHLSENPRVLQTLREAYDQRLSPAQAAELSTEVERVENLKTTAAASAMNKAGPSVESLSLELDALGREYFRAFNWPQSFRDLIANPGKTLDGAE